MAPAATSRTAFVSTGSPKSSRPSTSAFKVLDENNEIGQTPIVVPKELNLAKLPRSKRASPLPLQKDTRSNLQGGKVRESVLNATNSPTMGVEDILARLSANDDRGDVLSHNIDAPKGVVDDPLAKLLSNLQMSQNTLKQQEKDLKTTIVESFKDKDQFSGSELPTPATDAFNTGSSHTSQESDTIGIDHVEMLRVKKELEAAKMVISRQEQELAETRKPNYVTAQATLPTLDIDYGKPGDLTDQTVGYLQSAFNASARPFAVVNDPWLHHTDGRLNRPEVSHNPWNPPSSSAPMPALAPTYSSAAFGAAREPRSIAALNTSLYPAQLPPVGTGYAPIRSFSNSSISSLGLGARPTNDTNQLHAAGTARRNINQPRSSNAFSDPVSQYGSYSTAHTSHNSPPLDHIGMRAVGQTISPTISEFPGLNMPDYTSPWPVPINSSCNQTYVTPLEPMNYRRLLDKSVSCDWKYIVDKIVCNNDQQASIFLQQKLKVGTVEQKYDIVESIINQAYPLMINRFGNFLVQRCFEHGTPDQIIAIAEAIHGNVISLSTDPFGCHVIQKAFDSVPESHKADMVRELLRRIPETVIHRYACHVWQKLFELRWSGEPPQIMIKVNEALHGMWHEVAMGETGSLVVQNIFENCVEEEKRPAIEEVIANIDIIAHGQFGNWCIQHLCEHGSPPDKRRVVDHILINSYNYSIDQFASKVVEKCLKIGGSEFLDRYLGVITTAHPDRPRIPLIDIAGDQYGNYLIQWILMNTHPQQRDQVAMHIRKHMVSLRGSKFGSRVAMLCCNPGSVPRAAPTSVVIPNPFGAPGQPRGTYPTARYR